MKRLWKDRREGRNLRQSSKQRAVEFGPDTASKFGWACLVAGPYRGEIKKLASRATRFWRRQMDRSEIVALLSDGVNSVMEPLLDETTSVRHKKRLARSSITSSGMGQGIVFGPQGCSVSL